MQGPLAGYELGRDYARRTMRYKHRRYYSLDGTFDAVATSRTPRGREKFIFRPDLDQKFREPAIAKELVDREHAERARIAARKVAIGRIRAAKETRQRRNDLTARMEPVPPPVSHPDGHIVKDGHYYGSRPGGMSWNNMTRLPQDKLELLMRPTVIAGDVAACDAIEARVVADVREREAELNVRQRRVRHIRAHFVKQRVSNARRFRATGVPTVTSARAPTRPIKSPRTDVLATARPDPVVTQLASDPLGTVDYAGLLLHEATRQRGVRAKHQMKEALHAVAQAKGQPHASRRLRKAVDGFDTAVARLERVQEGPGMCKALAQLREDAPPGIPAARTLHPWRGVNRRYEDTAAAFAAATSARDENALQELASGAVSARVALRTQSWSPRAEPCKYQLPRATEDKDEASSGESEGEEAVAALNAFDAKRRTATAPFGAAAVGSRLFFAEDDRLRTRAATRGPVALNLGEGTRTVARVLQHMEQTERGDHGGSRAGGDRSKSGAEADNNGHSFVTERQRPVVPHLQLPTVA